MSNIEIRDQPNRRPGQCQFTIRSMLVLTAGVALACSFLFALPGWAASLAVLGVFLLVPGPLACLAIFGTRRQRAFAIGTLVPWMLFWLAAVINDFHIFIPEVGDRLIFVVAWLACVASGYGSVLTLRWIERTSRSEHPPCASESLSCDPPASHPLDR